MRYVPKSYVMFIPDAGHVLNWCQEHTSQHLIAVLVPCAGPSIWSMFS